MKQSTVHCSLCWFSDTLQHKDSDISQNGLPSSQHVNLLWGSLPPLAGFAPPSPSKARLHIPLPAGSVGRTGPWLRTQEHPKPASTEPGRWFSPKILLHRSLCEDSLLLGRSGSTSVLRDQLADCRQAFSSGIGQGQSGSAFLKNPLVTWGHIPWNTRPTASSGGDLVLDFPGHSQFMPASWCNYFFLNYYY